MLLLKNIFTFIIVDMINFIDCKMEPYIVGGKRAKINEFPYSVLLHVRCRRSFMCGSSTVNEKILLTAAHCVYNCKVSEHRITAYVGHVEKYKGKAIPALSWVAHEKYEDDTLYADLALIVLKSKIAFNNNVKRIALMPHPPMGEPATVAGWGYVNEINKESTNFLWYIEQFVWNTQNCKQLFRNMPKGTICASSGDETIYSSRGDSGSALVVRGYIQIGITSHKYMKDHLRSIIIYTDTTFFYNWITMKTKQLYCKE